ncbi:MAG TPA: GNAT family N-acetyltransferase [Micropepsaceae bacterium]|nr:GNAT family N-acetyltransferase [Micropepsaceae bacterium]
MLIRPATEDDAAALWSILEPVIRAGETYALARDMQKNEALAYWMGPDRETFVAVEENRIVGTYYLRPNQAGGGDHVANCGYVTDAAVRGRGIARRMCEHSLELARARGFRAMQFNFVVSTNEYAIRLWRSLGFDVVGRLPCAFHHPTLGDVDALVMFRPL